MSTSLRKLREKRETLVEAAAALQVDPGHLSRIERGDDPSMALARRISARYRKPIDYFFGNRAPARQPD